MVLRMLIKWIFHAELQSAIAVIGDFLVWLAKYLYIAINWISRESMEKKRMLVWILSC